MDCQACARLQGILGLTRGLREIDTWSEGSSQSREASDATPSTSGLFTVSFEYPANARLPELEQSPAIDTWFEGNRHVV
jgi:hypothetical protein